MLNQNLGRCTHCVFSRHSTIGFDFQYQLIQVSTLLNAGTLDDVAHALDRGEGGVQHNTTDRFGRVVAITAHGTWYIATAIFDLDLHVDLAAVRQVHDDVLRVDDFNIMRCLNISGGHRTFALFAQAQGDFVAVVQLENHALEVEQNVDDIFLHAVNRRVLVQNSGNRHFGSGMAYHRGQQNAAQCIAQCVAIAALEWLQRDFGTVGSELLNVDGFWFQ